MRVSASVRALCTFVCLGLLELAFVCLVWTSAAAQSCSGINGPLQVIYAGDDTVAHGTCFNTDHAETACPANPLTVHIDFGQTVDFFQPSAQTLDAHTVTSGTCCSTQDGNFRVPNAGAVFSNTMTSSTNYCVKFDRSSNPAFGNAMGHGTYNFYCEPHGSMMEGVLVVDPDSTTIGLSSGANPSTFGQSVTFTATVTNNSATALPPTGTITFFDGVTAISSALPFSPAGSSGTKTFTTSTLAGGVHSITAVYAGTNGDFAGGTSNAVSQTVNAANTSTALALTAGTNPTTAGQSLTFTASVSNASGTGVIPTGNAVFEDNGTPISTNALDGSGNAALTTSSLAGGTHPITAVYSPANANFNASTSSAINEAVHDFSINISNPSLSVVPNQTATYNGTLSAFGGYSGTITVSCQGSLPSTCTGSSVPLAANAQNVPFTVTASNNAIANFSFDIAGSGPESLTHSVPVTLIVSSFNFGALSPNTVSAVQGNPSGAMTFQVSSLGSFTGEVDMSCVSPPPGVTCFFSNGSSTQALSLTPGQVINDTLVLNTASSVTVGAHSVTVQAVTAAAPAQQQTVTLNETSATLVDAYLFFGHSTSGGFPLVTVNPPFLLDVGSQFSFDVSAVDNQGCLGCDAHNVNVTLVFAEPVVSASATGGSCTTVSPVEISCNLGTITGASPFVKTVTYTVFPLLGRSVDFTAFLSESNSNQDSRNVLSGSVKLRYRPLVRPGSNKVINPNPK